MPLASLAACSVPQPRVRARVAAPKEGAAQRAGGGRVAREGEYLGDPQRDAALDLRRVDQRRDQPVPVRAGLHVTCGRARPHHLRPGMPVALGVARRDHRGARLELGEKAVGDVVAPVVARLGQVAAQLRLVVGVAAQQVVHAVLVQVPGQQDLRVAVVDPQQHAVAVGVLRGGLEVGQGRAVGTRQGQRREHTDAGGAVLPPRHVDRAVDGPERHPQPADLAGSQVVAPLEEPLPSSARTPAERDTRSSRPP